MEHLKSTTVTFKHICAWSQKDLTLSRVIQYVNKGWPRNAETLVKSYESIKSEL